MRINWYLGVDIGDGLCDYDAVVSQKSKVAFEWCLQRFAGDVDQYIVTPRAIDVAKKGVPAPDCVRKTETPMVDLEHYITEAVAGAKGRLPERFGFNDLATVTCKYIGIVGTSGVVDINVTRSQRSIAAFARTVQGPECHWKEEVRARVMDCSVQHIPFPPCTVAHVRLQSAAHAATQAASDSFGFEIRYVYQVIHFLNLKRLFYYDFESAE